jgi:hypothetical protein
LPGGSVGGPPVCSGTVELGTGALVVVPWPRETVVVVDGGGGAVVGVVVEASDWSYASAGA